MQLPHTSVILSIVGGVLLLVLATGIYVGCYFGLCLTELAFPHGTVMRFYRYNWQARLFTPAGAVDSIVRGRTVEIVDVERPSE